MDSAGPVQGPVRQYMVGRRTMMLCFQISNEIPGEQGYVQYGAYA